MEEVKNRKVFISFLGTNNYLQARYQIGDEEPFRPARFVQDVLTDYICKDWTSNDKILIFYTKQRIKEGKIEGEKGSYELNWLDNGQSRVSEDKIVESKGLEGILKSKPFGSIVEGVEIKEGFSEDDVWNIFETVYNKLHEGDLIYFDVTHAFRSIPLFSTILFNFSHFLKNTSLVSVKYGAFEKLGPQYKLIKKEGLQEGIPIEKRIAPILDLTNVIQLQSLTQVASNFKNYGTVGDIGGMFNSNSANNKFNSLVKQLKNETEKLDDYIQTNKVEQIKEGKFAKEIKNQIKNIRKTGVMTLAQELIVNELESAVSCFSENGGNKNIEAAVAWALKYNMIQQAYILAEEYLISLGVHKYMDYCPYDLEDTNGELHWRNFVSSLLSVSNKDIKNETFKNELEANKELTLRLLQDEDIVSARKYYSEVSNRRNVLCHAKKTDLSSQQFNKFLEKNFYPCKGILSKSNILINLSNHPSSAWSEEQKGSFEIIDLPFPQVDPDGDADYIEGLADEYLQKIIEIGRDSSVHIMGEFNFCYCLINKLKELGIRCLASCTKRDTVEENGVKISKFKFVQFREY